MKKTKLIVLSSLMLVLSSSIAVAKDDIAFLAIHNDYWQVWLMDADGLNAHPITNSSYDKSRISWYPNGDLLVNGNQGELVRLSLLNKTESAVKIPFQQVNDAVISPDGKYLAFSQKPKGAIYNKMWLMDIQSGNKVKVGWTKGFQHEPNFSSNSQVLYYLSGDNGQSHDIIKYTIETRSIEPVTFAKLYNLDVALNKNNKMVFSSNRSGNYEVWMQDGNKLKILTNHPALDARPNWSLDGKQIYFESNRGGSLNIWSVNIEGAGKIKQITHNKVGARYPLWRVK